jgi:hypothetical protein
VEFVTDKRRIRSGLLPLLVIASVLVLPRSVADATTDDTLAQMIAVGPVGARVPNVSGPLRDHPVELAVVLDNLSRVLGVSIDEANISLRGGYLRRWVSAEPQADAIALELPTASEARSLVAALGKSELLGTTLTMDAVPSALGSSGFGESTMGFALDRRVVILTVRARTPSAVLDWTVATWERASAVAPPAARRSSALSSVLVGLAFAALVLAGGSRVRASWRGSRRPRALLPTEETPLMRRMDPDKNRPGPNRSL